MTTARVGIDITARDNTSTAFLSSIANVNKLAAATGRMADRQRNMAFQLNDVFTQLTTGTSPMTVLLQQGPQVAQIYGFGNGGVGAAFRDLGNMFLTVAKRVGPFALAAAAVASGLTYEVNRVTGETYSMGEVFTATMDVMKNSITETLMPAIRDVSPVTTSVFDFIIGRAKGLGNFLIGVNVAWIDVLKRGLSEIPDLFKYAAAAGANFFVQQIESMLNSVTRLLNAFSAGLNNIFDKLPEGVRPGKLGTIAEFKLPKFDTGALFEQVNNPFKGLGTEIGTIVGKDYIGGFVGAIGDQAAQNRVKAAVAGTTKKTTAGDKGAGKKGTIADKINMPAIEQSFDMVEDRFDAMQSVMDTFQNGITSAFGSIVDGTSSVSKAFSGMARSMLADVTKLFFNQAMQQLFNPGGGLGSSAGGLYSGGGGGFLSGVFGALFKGMPSFAVGADNVPRDMVAKIHKGEMIVPKSGADALRSGGLGGGVTIIDNRRNAPAIEQRQDDDGRLLMIINDAVDARVPKALKNQGLRSPLKRRG